MIKLLQIDKSAKMNDFEDKHSSISFFLGKKRS